jgi:hypothetical protein
VPFTSSTPARERSRAVEEDVSEHRLGLQGGLQDRQALHQIQPSLQAETLMSKSNKN